MWDVELMKTICVAEYDGDEAGGFPKTKRYNDPLYLDVVMGSK